MPKRFTKKTYTLGESTEIVEIQRHEDAIDLNDTRISGLERVEIPVDMTGFTKREFPMRTGFNLQSVSGLRARGIKLRVFRPITVVDAFNAAGAAWDRGVSPNTVAVTDNADTDPDGATLADRLAPESTGGRLRNIITGTNPANRAFRTEWWLKSASGLNRNSKLLFTGLVTPQTLDVLPVADWKLFRMESTKTADTGTLEIRIQPDINGPSPYQTVDFGGVYLYDILPPEAASFITLPFNILAGDILEVNISSFKPNVATHEQIVILEGTT